MVVAPSKEYPMWAKAWICDGCGKAHLAGTWAFQFTLTRRDTQSGSTKRFATVCNLDCLQLWLALEADRDHMAAG